MPTQINPFESEVIEVKHLGETGVFFLLKFVVGVCAQTADPVKKIIPNNIHPISALDAFPGKPKAEQTPPGV